MTAVHRRRRVLLALLLLNAVELVGVGLVSTGFWIGFGVTGSLLLAYVVHLRRRAVAALRLRRAQMRHATWIAAQQAAVRREHARRAQERREAARRAAAEREAARREARDYTERYGTRRAVGADPIDPAAPRAVLRGRPYEHGRGTLHGY